MDFLIRWWSRAFIVSASAMLCWFRLTESPRAAHWPTWPEPVLILASIVTLPGALLRVFKEGDAAARRNWVILFMVCLLVIAAAYVFHR